MKNHQETNKKNIGVFFGSRSPEHDISIITGQLVISGLRGLGYEVTPIYIGKDGAWHMGDKFGSMKIFQDAHKKAQLEGGTNYYLDLEQSNGKLVPTQKGAFKKARTIDIAFPALHGAYGEDGTIQGLFEMLNIPYVGCDVASSALAMDKVITKLLLQSLGIPTPVFVHVQQQTWETQKDELIRRAEEIGYPLFVKPARLGSSIAIEKTKTREELTRAIEVALHYDTKVLIEKGVEPMHDITCALLERNGEVIPSLLQESRFNADFFSYEDKYLEDGGAQLGKAHNKLVIPAELDDEITQKIQDTAVRIFKEFGCGGTTRVDFLYNPDTKDVWVNEINTLPGTLYHHLWEKTGIPLPEVLTALIEHAETRHEKKKELTHTFASNVLSQGTGKGGAKLSPKGTTAVL